MMPGAPIGGRVDCWVDDGVIDGRRLLPVGWAEQAATPTPFAGSLSADSEGRIRAFVITATL
jgi:hypothetical protein